MDKFIGIVDLMRRRSFPGQLESIRNICDFVVQVASDMGFNDSDLYAVELAVDEACTNIIEHAYGNKRSGEILCITEVFPDKLKIILQDNGGSFNPDAVPEPDTNLPINKVKKRGAGLYLMRKLMDDVKFDFTKSAGNILTMVKHKSE